MDTRVNHGKVAKVMSALVDACGNDHQQLTELLHVLATEGPGTGLGYIISDATRQIEAKLSLADPCQVG